MRFLSPTLFRAVGSRHSGTVEASCAPTTWSLSGPGFSLLPRWRALAACRAGDTLVVTKLDRLARSLPDARAIADPGRRVRSA
ncbi:MAG TPA: recombinase family protein [Actinomycetales bacterium]|nr:recombinase family protein [Actinomycetales bacterium]